MFQPIALRIARTSSRTPAWAVLPTAKDCADDIVGTHVSAAMRASNRDRHCAYPCCSRRGPRTQHQCVIAPTTTPSGKPSSPVTMATNIGVRIAATP